MVAPHLVLTGYIKAMKTAFSSGHPVVALACTRGAAGNTYDHRDNIHTRGILHICVLAVATSGILHHKSKVTV